MSPSNFLFALTGSIACYKACTLISKLVQAGHNVKCIATKSALEFVGKATLEGLSRQKVYSDTFEDGAMMEHIHLAKWADAIIIAPASANFVAKVAHGMADDLLSTTLLAADSTKPKFLAPAMNMVMWGNPKVQENLAELKQMGFVVLEPEEGSLACGDTGSGRLLDPEKIFTQVHNHLNPSYRKKVLITSGGTRESIDGVRFLTNFSTGFTGATLADGFIDSKTQVTLLSGQGSVQAKNPQVETLHYTDFENLKSQLSTLVDSQSYDLVIHAAAVSDFSVANPSDEKIASDEDLQLQLKRNEKLLPQLKQWSKNPDVKVVGFKLTSTKTHDKAMDQVSNALKDPNVHALVHNDFQNVTNDRNKHAFDFYYNDEKISVTSAKALASTIKGALL